MKNTLPAKRFSLSARPAIAFCLLFCVFSFLLSSALFAGSIVAWGNNGEPPAGNNFIAISAGGNYSLALKSDGSIIGWGSNHTPPPAGNNFIAIAAGETHSLALKSDGSIVGWGWNDYGQATPPDGNDFIAIAAGEMHSLALKSDGSIVGWGAGQNSQSGWLHYGQAIPPYGNNFIAIAAGGFHSLALKSDGSIVGWGNNYEGQATPPAGNNFIAIGAGRGYSLALKSDGTVVGWGSYRSPPCYYPVNDSIAIAAGRYHSLALKSDGSILGWGDNGSGQATPPDGNNFIAIAGGTFHSLALRREPFSDLNGDAFVDFLDYSVFAKNWQQTPDPCDPNNGDIILDGYVDIYDLAELVEQWLTYLVSPATIPRPANHAAYTEKRLVLRWSSGENSTSHDIYFGTDFNEVNNADITNSAVYMGNQYSNLWDTSNFDSNGLDFNTTYYWRIDEIALGYQTEGDVWDFTTALGKAKNPQPTNGQQYVTTPQILAWSAATYASSHDVYFGTDFSEVNDADITSSGVYIGNQDANFWDTNNYAPVGLDFNTTYYWRIDEVVAATTTKGDVWTFTTIPLPGQSSNPTPANAATDISIITDLSWTSGSDTTSHDVYFGTTNPPPFRDNQTSVTYDIGTMGNNTTYYWRIDEKNAGGTTTGNVWSFTTGSVGEANEVNLVDWWKFDEANGIIAYDSAGSNDGNLVGGPVWTNGKIGGGLNFDGINDYVNCGSEPGNYDNITVSVWMKTSTFGILVSNHYVSYSIVGTWYTLSSTDIEFGADSNGSLYPNVTFNTPTLDGAWHHIVYTKNGTSHAIYVDGSLDQQFISNADISQNAPLFIGKRWNSSSGSARFNGVIDEVRIYNMALNAEEIAYLYLENAKAYNPSPSDGQQNVAPDVALAWSPINGLATHDIYFGTDFNEVNNADIASSGVYMGSQDVNFWNTNNYAPACLDLNTTYYWRIDEVTPASITKGDVWSFSTVPPPPGQASNPNPANGLTDVNITTDLSWTAGSFAASHDVYFGTTNPPPFRGNQTGTTYDTATMDTNTTYYWRIDEKNISGTTTGNVWSFTTAVILPGQTSNPIPANGATDVTITTDLSWTAGSLAASHDVYFGTTNPPPFRGNQTGTTYDTGTMVAGTTYYWQVDEKNTSGTTTGILWSFVTIPLPGQASNPNPANGLTDVAITTDLSWTAGSLAASHDVYFGTTNPPQFRVNQTGTTYDTATMDTNTTYYWRIDEKNISGTTTGNVWSFTTAVILPGQTSNPIPANGATDVTITTDLSWTAGSLAASHDVYFGTTNPPPFRGNQTGTTYDTATMDTNTTYYWRIDEKNVSGTTTGDVWSFTTTLLSPPSAAWWKFDEGTGTIAYDSVGTNNGSVYGGAAWTTGKIGGALSFDGTNDYVDCGSGPSIYNTITVSAWMKTSTNGVLVSNRYDNGGYGTWYTLFSTGIEIGDNGQGGYKYLTFSTPTLNGLWHQIVYTKNGINHAIYVDGSLDQQFTSNADISPGLPLFIGKRWNITDSPGWFNGIIDDVRIYKRALSYDEIEQLYLENVKAYNPSPSDGQKNVALNKVLTWSPTSSLVTHDVYFGTNYNDVNVAAYGPSEYMGNQDTNNYAPAGLDVNTTYYWRIDIVTAATTTKGDVWSFTTKLDPNIPIAWWKFDEGTGTIAYDSAGNNYNGTITGATWYQDVSHGWCLNFDSSADYVTVPDTAALDMSSAITIAAWIKPANFAGYYFIVTKQPSGTAGSNYPGNYEFRTEASTGRLNFLHQTSSGTTFLTYTSTSGLTAGIWQHVVVTLGSGQVNFYIDGSLSGSTAQSGTFGILNNEPVRIGKRKDSSSYFNGSIDDVRIYNMALSADEVAILYAQ